MTSEDKFFLAVWSVVCTAVVMLMLMITLYATHSNSLIAEAIAKGVHPLDARCGYSFETMLCALRATQHYQP